MRVLDKSSFYFTVLLCVNDVRDTLRSYPFLNCCLIPLVRVTQIWCPSPDMVKTVFLVVFWTHWLVFLFFVFTSEKNRLVEKGV